MTRFAVPDAARARRACRGSPAAPRRPACRAAASEAPMMPQDGSSRSRSIDIGRHMRPVEGADAEMHDARRDARAVVGSRAAALAETGRGARIAIQPISISALISPVFCVAQSGMSRTASARCAMGDQAVDGNIAAADRRDDALKVLGGGVAAAEQGHFLAVEVRVREGDRLLDHADQHVAAAMGDEVEALLHARGCRSRRRRRRSRSPSVNARTASAVAFGWNARRAGDRLALRPRVPRSRSSTATSAPGRAARTARRRGRSGRRRRPGRGRAPTTAPRRTAWAPMARNSTVAHSSDAQAVGADEVAGRHATAARSCRHPGGRRAPRSARSSSACRAAGDAVAAGEIGIDDADLAGRQARAVAAPRRPRRRARGPSPADTGGTDACPRRCDSRCRRCRRGAGGPAPASRIGLRSRPLLELQLARLGANKGVHSLHVMTCRSAIVDAEGDARAGHERRPSPRLT